MRYAIFFTPPPDSALLSLAHAWIGRNAFDGSDTPVSAIGSLERDAIRDLSSFPRLYGFHATFKAPFRLSESRTSDELHAAVSALAKAVPAAGIDSLELKRLGAHFALMPAAQSKGLSSLAASCVTAFEPFRAALTQAEIDRRQPAGLSERQRDYLMKYGYPYVFDAFRFHMTLTRAVAEIEAPHVDGALRKHFKSVIGQPLLIDGIGLFRQPAAGENFIIDHYAPLLSVNGSS